MAVAVIADSRSALDLVGLPPLMERTQGHPDMVVGILDGPVMTDHRDLASDHLREATGGVAARCSAASSVACQHGTFVAGILGARRGTAAPAICPGSTLLIRPIFAEMADSASELPEATPEALAAAIVECIQAGGRVLNVSAALGRPSPAAERALDAALDYAAQRGVLVVAAAGNQAGVGSWALTRHPWVIPVAAFDRRGRPLASSNLGHSMGRRGLGAPGDGITSLGTGGAAAVAGGTSAAAPFVTGAIALLWSLFPRATAGGVKLAVTRAVAARRRSVVPPLMDAWAAYQALAAAQRRG